LLSGFWLISAKASSTQSGVFGIFFDVAISWGVGTLAGIGGAALFSNPITVAVVLVGLTP
jgi:hypothetical protein